MGSQDEEKYITVLVTGFEAFQQKYPRNPSYEIGRLLPEILRSEDGCLPIRIILHQPAVPVVYESVYELIPRLLDAYSNSIDMVLHIGMASSRNHYTIEKYANRDGYTTHKDLDGKVLDEDFGLKHFEDCSTKMTSSFDFTQLWKDWLTCTPTSDTPLLRHDLCQSENAGNFLCDFIYLNSLAYYARKKDSTASHRPVMFFHVPGAADDQTLSRGKSAAIGLIRAMARQVS